MSYTPNDTILKKYANVLVNFALGGGKGIKKGEVVRVSASESAKPLFIAVCNTIVDAGGHVLSHYGPDDEQGDKRRNISASRYFYEHAEPHQLDFFPKEYLKGVVDQMDHSVFLLAEKDPTSAIGPTSPVRPTWVPPQSSTDHALSLGRPSGRAPIETTRTSSPYFSPKSAIAPESTASSRSISRVTTGVFCKATWLASASTSSISSSDIGFGWEKSKRRRSGATSEPFCATWLPRMPRSAACRRWVAEWLA